MSSVPVDENEGATGDGVLEIDLPDDTHLEDYAITEEGRQTWEWIVPAALINQSASVSLLTEAEVDEVIASSWC